MGVFGTFLLPGLLHAAIVQAATQAAPAAAKSGARPIPPLVMLDPGHGGKDPGAIGVSGTYEKLVALATAEELKRQLEATGRYRVAMTRSRDEFIPLDDRVAHAQSQGAALFVSMHADALSDHGVRGASVYTLATSASDAQTAALAQRGEQRGPLRRAGRGMTRRRRSPASWRASCGRKPVSIPSGWRGGLVGSLDQDLPMLPKSGAPCRICSAQGRRHPQRSGRDWGSCPTRATRRRSDSRIIARKWPRR